MAEIDRFLGVLYTIELIPEQGGGFTASHPDLPGCVTQGDTAEEAIADLAAAKEAWIASRLDAGLPIPEPLPQEFSGKVLLRMSSGLHSDLARMAQRSGVSLNLLINTALAEYAGYARAVSELREAVAELARPPLSSFPPGIGIHANPAPATQAVAPASTGAEIHLFSANSQRKAKIS